MPETHFLSYWLILSPSRIIEWENWCKMVVNQDNYANNLLKIKKKVIDTRYKNNARIKSLSGSLSFLIEFDILFLYLSYTASNTQERADGY